MHNNIYDFAIAEEKAYELPIRIVDNYDWSMKEHVILSTLYKNSIFRDGKNDDKPFKNITKPILNLQYRAEGFDVKDIEIFIDDPGKYFKSFLVKKYHDKWARENRMDTFIDEVVESYVDFGGVLVKNVNDVKPEVVQLQSIAFCDQTDILSGPIAIRHSYSPDQLKDTEKMGWGNKEKGATVTIDELLLLLEKERSQGEKSSDGFTNQKNKTPGKYIEVYEIHGTFPKSFLNKGEEDGYSQQLHIVCFTRSESGGRVGNSLLAIEEKELPFKFLKRDPIFGRALGFGGAEELFEPQAWLNYDVIRMKEMLDGASKILYKTTDHAFANRNRTLEMEMGEILDVEDNKDISQLNTTPINITLFERSVSEWEAHAQMMGAANDSILGKSPSAGTPFKLQELVTMEAHSLHEYRKGKIATFFDEIYKDWVIENIGKEVVKGQTFLAELNLDELQMIADSVVACKINDILLNKVLDGKMFTTEEVEVEKEMLREDFMKGGSKRFIEIFKNEMKDVAMSVRVNIAGKQKDLAGMVDKLGNVVRMLLSTWNPQTQTFSMFEDPYMVSLFNEILEKSGMTPRDFGSYKKKQLPQQPGQQLGQQPMPQLPQPANA